MTSEQSVAGFFAGLCVGAILVVVVVGISLAIIAEIQLDAIKHGVGEYYLDASFSREFRWKTNGVAR